MKMTIEEAIRHLKDLSKCESYLWLSDIQAINIAVKALEENAELKRLLKLAVEDFEILGNEIYCSDCDFNFMCRSCPLRSNNGNCSKGWKHTDEAMKLIGGDNE